MKKSSTNHAKVDILGVGVSAINMDFAVQRIDTWIENNDKNYIVLCNVHTIMECQNDNSTKKSVNGAGMVTPDGMPLVWLANLESENKVERVYGPDLMLALCEHSTKRGYRHFFYGGETGVPEQLAQEMSNRFPGLQVAGGYSPPFRSLTTEEEVEINQIINEANPDIVWVGLGTPKQDIWMAKHRPHLNAPVIIGVGAAFDFHTNRVRQAPLWMQRNGLEWLFRLSQEPSRLWYRYLVYNPWFIFKLISQKIGLNQRRLKSEMVASQVDEA